MARAGGRPCQIEIWGPGDSTATGEPNPAPVLFKTLWGSLIPQRGTEYELDKSRVGWTYYRVRLDFLDGQGIDGTMIVTFEGQTFGVDAVLVDYTTRKTVDLILIERKVGA